MTLLMFVVGEICALVIGFVIGYLSSDYPPDD
jgi:hypothetical protein